LTRSGKKPATLDDVVLEQKSIKTRLEDMSRIQGKVERGQMKFKEHEKKKNKFLSRMMDKLSSLYCSQDSEDYDGEDLELKFPTTSSSE